MSHNNLKLLALCPYELIKRLNMFISIKFKHGVYQQCIRLHVNPLLKGYVFTGVCLKYVGLQEHNMITSEFEILRHALFAGPILTKVHPHPLVIFSQSDSSTALCHINTYDVHEQSESKHLPDALSMVGRYLANVCKIVCQWMSPHMLHASFPNLLSVTVTSDPINCLPIILGHRGRIHLMISADDLPYVTNTNVPQSFWLILHSSEASFVSSGHLRKTIVSLSDESDLCLSTIRSVTELHLVLSSGHFRPIRSRPTHQTLT